MIRRFAAFVALAAVLAAVAASHHHAVLTSDSETRSEEVVITDVLLRGTNLTDEEERNHVSFLKDVAPLPGRDVSLVYRLSF